ncbi:hypothetical protein [Glutamicibacter ardleyensis]
MALLALMARWIGTKVRARTDHKGDEEQSRAQPAAPIGAIGVIKPAA